MPETTADQPTIIPDKPSVKQKDFLKLHDVDLYEYVMDLIDLIMMKYMTCP